MPRKYGDREGLPESLEKWAERLSKDKSFPWPGCGIIADLKSAATELRGHPATPKVEFDL